MPCDEWKTAEAVTHLSPGRTKPQPVSRAAWRAGRWGQAAERWRTAAEIERPGAECGERTHGAHRCCAPQPVIAPTTRLQSLGRRSSVGMAAMGSQQSVARGEAASGSGISRWLRHRLGEADLAAVKVLDARATFVNEAVVSSAQAHEIGEIGFAAIDPMFDVVAIDHRVRAARKPANGGWNGSRLAPDVEGLASLIAEHWHHARVAQKPPRRSRGPPDPHEFESAKN